MSNSKWIVSVKGNPSGSSWEISVLRADNTHGIHSYGWFDEDKLLISHSSTPCRWPLAPGLGPFMVELANRYAAFLNDGGEFVKLI